jgi:hypothetical protein
MTIEGNVFTCAQWLRFKSWSLLKGHHFKIAFDEFAHPESIDLPLILLSEMDWALHCCWSFFRLPSETKFDKYFVSV